MSCLNMYIVYIVVLCLTRRITESHHNIVCTYAKRKHIILAIIKLLTLLEKSLSREKMRRNMSRAWSDIFATPAFMAARARSAPLFSSALQHQLT